MDAIEFFQAIENGAEYRLQDIPRLIEDDYDRENAERMFADFVCASGKRHLMEPSPGGGTPLSDYNPNQPRDWRGRWTKAGGIGDYFAFRERVSLLNQNPTEEERAWARLQLGEALEQDRFMEGSAEHARIHALYSRAGGNPEHLAQELAELREQFLSENPDLRTKTETEIEAEWDQFNKAMETGDRSLAPPGGIERMNALMNEIERRQRAYEAARLENITRMSDDELSEFVERERQRYVDDVTSMTESERTLYRRARGESERRESDRIIAWREEARLRIINEELSSYENMSTSDLTTEHMRANEALLHSGDGPRTPHSVMLQQREAVIREELRVRRDIENVGTTSIRNLETWASYSDNQRLAEAARTELARRKESLAPIKQAVQTDFEGAKELIIQAKGGIPSQWPQAENFGEDDDENYSTWGAADELEARGFTPADVVKPFMAKHFYENDENLAETTHRVNVRDDRSVEISVTSKGATVNRTISDEGGSLVVSHDYFQLSEDKQSLGISKEIMRSAMPAYEKMGVSRIDVHANINAGGYVWARYGFVPDTDSWRTIQYRLQEYQSEWMDDDGDWHEPLFSHGDDLWSAIKSDDPKAIWEVADSPAGRQMLAGTDWYGSLDMDDDEAVNRFKKYAGKK